MSCTVTIAEFKTQFDRGQFTYSATLPDIRDEDITKAIAETQAVFNQDLFPTEALCEQALLYLTAHLLKLDTEAADSGGNPSLLQQSRSADGFSESLHIPKWMQEGEFAFYSTTYYGQKFIILAKPYLDGAVFSVPGGTRF